MKSSSKATRRLRLEGLETRTLLAADAGDPFGLVADFNLTMHAVSGSADIHASFSTNFGDHKLNLSGNSDISVTIDLNQLPSFITNLDLSSFKDVQIVGTGHIDNLILTSIGSVVAPGLTVSQATTVTDVSSLSIAYLGINGASLWGSDMMLTATSLDGTQVFTNLHSLTVTSESKNVMFDFEARDGAVKDQTLNFTYAPQVVAKYGISEDAIHFMVTPTSSVPAIPTTPTGPVDSGDPGSTTSDAGHTGTDTGTVDPVTPTTPFDPSQVVIVNLSLDDRSRALLEQLRGLMHSTDADSQQKVLDLLNHANSLSAGPAVNPLLPGEFNVPIALLGDGQPSSLHLTDSSANVAASADVIGFTAVGPRFDAPLTRLLPEPVVNVASEIFSSPVVQSSVENGPALSTALLASSELGLLDAATVSASEILYSAPTLGESVRALGNYIAERMAAEFSPGQQSFVLLVDPQPTRRDGNERKASAEGVLGGLEFPTASKATAAA